MWRVLMLLTILFVFQIIAIKFFLYWSVWWFDIPMHILGGVAAGLLSVTLYHFYLSRRQTSQSKPPLFLVTLAGVFIFGIFWEIWEYSFGLTLDLFGNYRLDTVKDISADLLGGCLAYRYFLLKIK